MLEFSSFKFLLQNTGDPFIERGRERKCVRKMVAKRRILFELLEGKKERERKERKRKNGKESREQTTKENEE